MKTNKALSALILLVGLLGFMACSKSAAPPEYIDVNGVQVQLPKLQSAFASANAEQKSVLAQVSSSIRYGKYFDAMVSLDKLANDSGASEPQKKVVNEVIDQLKQAMNKTPAK